MKTVTVKKVNAGERIDKFLKREFFSLGMTRGEIIKNIKAGSILVNNKKVKPSYKLCPKDKIISNFPASPAGGQFLPPQRDPARAVTISKKILPNSKIKIKVIYQDENLIVVDKPAELQVHPDHNEKKNTLVNWLIAKFPEVKDVVYTKYIPSIYDADTNEARLRPGIVHRLDKDTSGVMVVARNQKTFEELKKLFKEHKVEKKYLALVYGILKNKKGVIEKPIARAGTYKKQVIAGRKTKTKIREAVTHYKVFKEFNNYSLLEVTPKTGRMHQIRVHLFSIGHPIVGDKLYKLKNIKSIPAPRQILHAQSLKFKLFGKNYSFSSLPPADFKKAVKIID